MIKETDKIKDFSLTVKEFEEEIEMICTLYHSIPNENNGAWVNKEKLKQLLHSKFGEILK